MLVRLESTKIWGVSLIQLCMRRNLHSKSKLTRRFQGVVQMCQPPVKWMNALKAWSLCPSIGTEQLSLMEIQAKEPNLLSQARTQTSKTWPIWQLSGLTGLSLTFKWKTKQQQARLDLIRTLPLFTKTTWRNGRTNLKSLWWIEHSTRKTSFPRKTGQYLQPILTSSVKTPIQSWMKRRDIQEVPFSPSILSSNESLRGAKVDSQCMHPLTSTLTMLATHRSSITW